MVAPCNCNMSKESNKILMTMISSSGGLVPSQLKLTENCVGSCDFPWADIETWSSNHSMLFS